MEQWHRDGIELFPGQQGPRPVNGYFVLKPVDFSTLKVFVLR